jgi:S-formylglutathione hydrolase FrmB
VLGLSTSMTVLLPQRTTTQIGMAGGGGGGDGPPPVLYLLHGLSDDDTTWVRRTSIERYAAPLGLAVVMPQVHRSFYADQAYGGRYWTFLSEELPALVAEFFRVSARREDTFVAGLSMGGYGAFRWALRHPERFAAAASLSGALDVAWLHAERRDLFDRVFGGPARTGEDLFQLLSEAEAGALPALYVGCGTEDHLYQGSVRFAEEATRAGCDVHTDFRPGEHEWGLWDEAIRDVLAWLPLHR